MTSSNDNFKDLFSKLKDALEENPPEVALWITNHIEATLSEIPFLKIKNEPQETTKKLLTVPQVAEMIGTPKAYVYDLVRKREISSVKIGKYIRIKEDDLKIFLENNNQNPLDKDLYRGYTLRYGR